MTAITFSLLSCKSSKVVTLNCLSVILFYTTRLPNVATQSLNDGVTYAVKLSGCIVSNYTMSGLRLPDYGPR